MNKLKIVLISTFAAMGYGVLHDQITARVCLEYFTVAHPPLFHTASPTRLAIYWGMAATAGIGLAWGTVLALVSQSRGLPPTPPGQLGRRISVLLVVMACSATSAGFAGYQLSRHAVVSIPAALAGAIPDNLHDRFMAVWFAHMASYLVGFIGAAVLIFRVWKARGKPMVLALYPHNRLGLVRAAVLAAVVALIIWWRFLALS